MFYSWWIVKRKTPAQTLVLDQTFNTSTSVWVFVFVLCIKALRYAEETNKNAVLPWKNWRKMNCLMDDVWQKPTPSLWNAEVMIAASSLCIFSLHIRNGYKYWESNTICVRFLYFYLNRCQVKEKAVENQQKLHATQVVWLLYIFCTKRLPFVLCCSNSHNILESINVWKALKMMQTLSRCVTTTCERKNYDEWEREKRKKKKERENPCKCAWHLNGWD